MRTTIFLILLAIALGVFFLFYMGVFSKVFMEEQVRGPYVFAYVEHIGPYSGVGKPMAELEDKMREAGFDPKDGIGVYYDDPKTKPKSELRSDVGFLITDDDMGKIEASREKFNFKRIEAKNYLVAEFPMRNIISYMIGPMKVYPAFNKYMEEKKFKASSEGIEIYDMRRRKIIFMMEITDFQDM